MKKFKRKKVTVTKGYIDQLKYEISSKNEELTKVERDRDQFRVFFLKFLKENVAMTSKNECFSSQTTITKLSKLMNEVQPWYWG